MKTCLNVLHVWTCLFFLLYSSEVLKSASSQENEAVLDFGISEESDLENIPKFVESEEVNSLPKMQQFKTAEMADAVMGTETAIDPAEIHSLFPKHQNPQGFSPPCDEDQCEAEGQAEEEVSMEVTLHGYMSAPEENSTETTKTFKVTCDKRNVTGVDLFSVQLLNASQDLMEFLSPNSSECSVVLFFTSWCQFSASLAPHFNALPRVFPSMHFLALDASQHSSLSTRFGTVAVPNILLFQGAKPMARFNHTDRTLQTLTSFISNQTGFVAEPDLSVTEQDLEGPLRAVPQRGVDWLLVFSILFIIGFSLYATLRTDSIRWLIPGQDHEHQD